MHRVSDARAWALNIASAGLIFAGLDYLAIKTISAWDDSGYDFRYIWTAGKMWAEGLSPYQRSFGAFAKAHISQGHVPELWAYPPNWWPICTLLGLLSLPAAAFAWNALNTALMFGSSLLIAIAYKQTFPIQRPRLLGPEDVVFGVWPLAAGHFLLMAIMEATGITMAVGQTSVVIYFGASALLYGISARQQYWVVLGLVLLMLKPQIGGVFAAVMLFNPATRSATLRACVVSVAIALPALVLDPGTPSDFLTTLKSYDKVASDAPGAMTGLRLLLWAGVRLDIGSALAAVAALGAALAAVWLLRGSSDEETSEVAGWRLVVIATAATLTISPLHYYDFLLVGILLLPCLRARISAQILALVGIALVLRADQLGLALGLYDHKVGIFEGSGISTIGAILLAFAAWGGVQGVVRLNLTTESPKAAAGPGVLDHHLLKAERRVSSANESMPKSNARLAKKTRQNPS